jgi:hypothetical protein
MYRAYYPKAGGFRGATNLMAKIRGKVYSAALDALEDDSFIVILAAYPFRRS